MDASRHEIRLAVGRTLRRMRVRRRLSLDDVEQLTRETGVRVTRSHLSRVETGCADIAVPRLLCLLRALGEPPDDAVRALDALLEPCDLPPTALLARARGALANADAARAVRLLRAALAGAHGDSDRDLLLAWAAAEACIGCWPNAARALTDALPPSRADEASALRLAAACLGAGRVSLASLLVRAVGEASPRARLVDAACRLARGEAESAARLATAAAAEAPADRLERPVSFLLLSESYAASGQPRASLRAAERVVRESQGGIALAEGHVSAARASGLARRHTAGLRHLERARALARAGGVPFLLARVHDAAATLWTAAGDRRAARTAIRAARSIRRRHGAAADAVPLVPLLSIVSMLMPADLSIARAASAEGSRSGRSPR